MSVYEDLHAALANEFLARIKGGEAPAGVMKEAREFLKDNGMQDARQIGPIRSLAAQLPHTDEKRAGVPFPSEEPRTGTDD